MPDHQRPSLSAALTASELMRWYWLKDELTAFARTLGIRSSGDKELLTQRIAASLDGLPFDEPPKPHAGRTQLAGALSATTIIPRGQRCSQLLRVWFSAELGPTFRFDGPMRDFIAGADGTQTLHDALDHYRAMRGRGPAPIDAQFEFNRFTRAWYAEHPSGTRAELLHAWQVYRDSPLEARGRI